MMSYWKSNWNAFIMMSLNAIETVFTSFDTDYCN